MYGYLAGNRNIITHDYDGYLFEGSDDEFSHYLIKILHDSALAQRLSKNGQKTALNKFDKKVVVQSIMSLYEKVLK